MCKSSWNFKGFCFNSAATTHTIMRTHTLTEWFRWRNCQMGLFRLAQCITQMTNIHLHQNAPSLYFIKLHHWYMKSRDTCSDCVLWECLVHMSDCMTIKHPLERERSWSNHNIHISHWLSCLHAVRACISGIGVTIVTNWASAYACIHPNEMINTHLTRLVVILVYI